MDFSSLKEFIQLAKDEGVSQLKFEGDGFKFQVGFPVAGSEQTSLISMPNTSLVTPALNVSKEDKVSSNLIEIKSPFVGTFYTSPSPDKAPYVKVGDRVSEGQVLCILEAMKIMNEIESDCSGEIVEICKENESLVEFGEVIFRLRK